MLASRPTSWKSVKQTLIAPSTIEAEFIACHEVTLQAIWLQNFISGLIIVDSISKPIKVSYDNFAAVFFSKNNKYSSKSKYIDLNYHIVKNRARDQKVSTEHISTDSMLADPFTKALALQKFK